MQAVFKQQTRPYIRQLWRLKWFALVIAWTICVIGWPIVAMIPPQYESSTRVYVNADQLLTPLLRGLAVDDNPVRHVEYLQRTLLSRPNLEQVIRLSDLDLSSGSAADPQKKEDILRHLMRQVVIKSQTANLITIVYRDGDPTVAKNVVQALLTVFAENSTGRNRREIDNAKRFLNQQLQTYEAQLRAAERRRAEFHQKYMDLIPGIDGATSRVEAGRSTVAKLQLDLSDAITRRDALQRELATVPKSLSVDSTAPQVIVTGRSSGARARLETAQTKLDELRTRFTEQHPDIVALRKQIADLEPQAARDLGGADGRGGRKTEIPNPLYDQVKVRLVDAEAAVASAGRRLKQAEEEQATLEDRARATPGVQAEAQNLDRDYQVKKKNFEEFLQRREQATIAEAADTTADKIQFRVIDAPQVPIVPVAPNQPMLLSAVFVMAVGAAIGLPLLLLQFDKSIATVTALRELGLPVLGSVSAVALPSRRRHDRMQIIALTASASVLFVIYGALLVLSMHVYRLVLI